MSEIDDVLARLLDDANSQSVRLEADEALVYRADLRALLAAFGETRARLRIAEERGIAPHLVVERDAAVAALAALDAPYHGGAVHHIEALHEWQRDALDHIEALHEQRDALANARWDGGVPQWWQRDAPVNETALSTQEAAGAALTAERDAALARADEQSGSAADCADQLHRALRDLAAARETIDTLRGDCKDGDRAERDALRQDAELWRNHVAENERDEEEADNWYEANRAVRALPQAEREAAILAGAPGIMSDAEYADIGKTAATMPAFVRACLAKTAAEADRDRLTAEVERLTRERDEARDTAQEYAADAAAMAQPCRECADLRAENARLAAEVERLTRERGPLTHAAGYAAEEASMRSALDESTAHVDRLLGALAEVREAASEARGSGCVEVMTFALAAVEGRARHTAACADCAADRRLDAALAGTADLAAERDRSVRAEALRDAAAVCFARADEFVALEAEHGLDDKTWYGNLCAWQACTGDGHRLRAEADRIEAGK